MCMPGLKARQVTCQAGCQLLNAEAQLPALPAALAHQPAPVHRPNSALHRAEVSARSTYPLHVWMHLYRQQSQQKFGNPDGMSTFSSHCASRGQHHRLSD